MLERGVGAQRPEERLLERVLGALPSEAADEHAEDLVAVLVVEALEGRDHGCVHHRRKRRRAQKL